MSNPIPVIGQSPYKGRIELIEKNSRMGTED